MNSIDHDPARNRVADLQFRMQDAGIDVMVLQDADSVFYFADVADYLGMEFARATLLVVPRDAEPVLITPAMEAEMVRRQTWLSDVRDWSDGVGREWAGPLMDVLAAQDGVRTLGVERAKTHPLTLDLLPDAAPNAEIVDAAAIIGDMRMVKSPGEIAIMRQAGQVAVAMGQAGRDAIGEGVPEYEVALAVIAGGTRKAAEFLEGDPAGRWTSPTIHNLQILQSGHDTCMVHRRSTTRRLEKGDPVYMCFCGIANFRNFRLGFDREYFVGAATDEQQRVYETAVAAQQAALAAIRPGVIAEDVNTAAEEVYQAGGFGASYRTGRGIGWSYLEPPELKRGDRTKLRAGMTFAVDGGITVPGEFGGRIGDSIVVTDDGFEYLTDFPRDFTVL